MSRGNLRRGRRNFAVYRPAATGYRKPLAPPAAGGYTKVRTYGTGGVDMDIEVKLEPGLAQPRVVIHAAAEDEAVRAIRAALEGLRPPTILAYRGNQAVVTELAQILRFFTLDDRVLAQTRDESLVERSRLYELEETLPQKDFVRVSQSEIVNLRHVTALDLGLSGTIRMTLDGGAAVSYASRRYVKKLKQAVGL